MSTETETTNVENVQELYDSFADGDVEVIRALIDPDVELHEPRGLPGGGTFGGTGKSVAYDGAHVLDFEDGRIVEWTSFADTALFNAALED